MIGVNTDRESLISQVRSRLSAKRFEHTLGVCKMAELLSDFCLPEDREEIFIAALLHDIAKELAESELRDIIAKEGIVLTDADTAPVLHSYAAPHVVKRDFSQLATHKVLSAVEKHTVGDSEMSVFDEIIFLADYIEDGRTYNDCVETRRFMLSSLSKHSVDESVNALHKACIMSMERTCDSLSKRGAIVNPRTLDAIDSLKNKIQ